MSHLGIPLAIFEKVALAVLLLKAFDMFNSVTVFISTIVIIGVVLLIGYIDVKFGIYDLETSMNNKYNPELRKIILQTNKRR